MAKKIIFDAEAREALMKLLMPLKLHSDQKAEMLFYLKNTVHPKS